MKRHRDALFRRTLERAVVATTLGEMLEAFFAELRTELPLSACVLYMREGPDRMLRMTHQIGLGDTIAARVGWLALEASVLYPAFSDARASWVGPDALVADPVLGVATGANVGSLVAVPLGIDDEFVGFVVLGVPPDTTIAPPDLEFLDTMGRWLGLGLERLQTRERLRDEQSSLERLTNALPDLIAYIDVEERLRFANEAHRRLLGLDPATVQGRHVAEVLGRRAYARNSDALHKALSGEALTYGDHLPLPGGDLPVLIRLVPDVGRDGKVRGCFCDIADVSQLERIQAELRAQTERLERMDRHKDEFLAMLGHELRNPLQAIDHGLRLLADPTLENVERARIQRMMRNQLDQLTSLLEDLLDLTRIARGKIKLDKHPIDVVDVIRRAVAAAQKTFADKQHELTVRVPPSLAIQADACRLEQILMNLLHNAVKFTPPGGHIEIRARREDDTAVLAVKDDGEGLSHEAAARIFDSFTQVDSAREGLGIGLALVRRLVDLHQGTIDVTSNGPGHGSEFTVRLPIGDLTQPRPEPPRATEPPANCDDYRILVVDDNEDAAESLALLLRRRGCDVETVNTGADAIKAVHRRSPHLILLDIGLPDMDGFEVAEVLRADPVSAPIDLVAITGFGDEGTRQRAHDVGFAARLVKPIDPDVVMQILHEKASRPLEPQATSEHP